jgi:hypothetical protein
MKVGGRDFDWSKCDVERAMRGVDPEPIRTHVVELLETVFPPKQVLARVTGWDRQSFTTMEAQRVLTKLGFTCRRADALPNGRPAWVLDSGEAANSDHSPDRIAALEAALATAQEAIAGLRKRVQALDERG